MLKSLTSLRFVFALMVLLSHCASIDPFFRKNIFQEGFVGVSFFFILSGFIISYSYKNKIEGHSVSKRTFWVGRIARIYPLHVFTLFVTIFLHREMWHNAVSWLGHFIPNLFLLQAFIPKAGYYYSFNSPSWSLCCEMLFYGLFPFLVKWFRSAWWLVGTIALFGLAIVFGMGFTPEDETVVNTIWYVNPLVRLADFLWACCCMRFTGNGKTPGGGGWRPPCAKVLQPGCFCFSTSCRIPFPSFTGLRPITGFR